MQRTFKRLTSTLLALLVAGTIAAPASARSVSARFGSSCDRWYCQLLQQLPCFGTKPDLPETGLPDADGPEVPEVPETDTPDTDLPESDAPDAELPDTNLPETDRPGSGDPNTPDTPDTPGTDDSTSSVSALERQVVALVNQERAAYGLPALTLSVTLSDGARLKSQDMRDNRYFDHNSPTYGTPFEMMQSLGITYAAAAENIAMGYSTAEAVVNGWMNSAGHRANILSSNYTHIGVGHVDGYWTQWFTR